MGITCLHDTSSSRFMFTLVAILTIGVAVAVGLVGLGLGGVQAGGQSIDLPLQFSDPAIGLLLSLAAGNSDDAIASGLGTSSTRTVEVLEVGLAPHLEASTGLARSRSFRVGRTIRRDRVRVR